MLRGKVPGALKERWEDDSRSSLAYDMLIVQMLLSDMLFLTSMLYIILTIMTRHD